MGCEPGTPEDFSASTHAAHVEALCVLASGSSGNCTLLRYWTAPETGVEQESTPSVLRLCMIDAGLSPRRTYATMHAMGLRPDQIDDLIVTHFDADHYLRSWGRLLPAHARIHHHAAHAAAARACRVPPARQRIFESEFTIGGGVRIQPLLVAHDAEGAAAFRIELPAPIGERRSLGFATDVGSITPELLRHLDDVSVLAIESNYCPVLQESSGRPLMLRRRIMGGSGHLSNQEAAHFAASVRPRESVVLLHLSRECNTPELAAGHHSAAPYRVIVTDWRRPTHWVPIPIGVRGAPPPEARPVIRLGHLHPLVRKRRIPNETTGCLFTGTINQPHQPSASGATA